MKITRLRLLGFKSFVEPTELVIEKGLTGVVGPNGCGKSNLLEALRWVMGETSYKSMRASAMEDVIFAGTNARPARNMAEVTISIDNAARTAPAELNDADVLEVTRRIERDAGSAYRVNGGEVRQRDIKLLFEDAATGARSPALVRQGQIAEIVNAKPEQRRRILEDAAGVAGLHSRRHEAELRLKAAEGNLARVNDVLGQLGGQIEALKRQARQAKRYRELSSEIRKCEALLLHLSWTGAQGEVVATEAALWESLSTLAAATEKETAGVLDEAQRAEAMGPLREEEARRGAALARIRIEQETFEKEARRLADRQRELMARAEQMQRDIAREQQLVAEAREIIDRLAGEAYTITVESESGVVAEEAGRERLGSAEAALGVAEARLGELTRRAIEARARRRSLESAHAERIGHVRRIEQQLVTLAAQARDIAAKAPDAERLQQLSMSGQRLMREVGEIEAEALVAEEHAVEVAAEARVREQASQTAKLTAGQLRTEVETLTKLLLPTRDDGLPPMIDELRVAPGTSGRSARHSATISTRRSPMTPPCTGAGSTARSTIRRCRPERRGWHRRSRARRNCRDGSRRSASSRARTDATCSRICGPVSASSRWKAICGGGTGSRLPRRPRRRRRCGFPSATGSANSRCWRSRRGTSRMISRRRRSPRVRSTVSPRATNGACGNSGGRSNPSLPRRARR